MKNQLLTWRFLSLLACLCMSIPAFSQDDIDAKVEALLSQMTLAEKVGQMNQYNGFWEATGPAPAAGAAKDKYDDLRNGRVGSMLNVRGVDNVREIQKLVVENSRLGIPLMFASDVIHGYKTLAPIPLAEAASWDIPAIQNSARIAAVEASATGLNWTFAPMMDISRDPRWGRVMEGGGEDPYLGSKIAVARVRGFQGDDLSANNTILACAKHFAAYGFAEAGRDYNTVDVGTSTLHNVVFPPFKAAIEEAGVRTVMNSFNLLNGIPATSNVYLQREVLKNDWDFPGLVVSDWGSISEISLHGQAEDLRGAARLAAIAGSDVDMESYAYVGHLEELVLSSEVRMALIDDAVRRILRLKFELGLFDDPYRYCDNAREEELLYNEAHQAAALDMAKRSIVLLKNEDDLLPLRKDQSITVIGTLADDKTSPLGSWRIGSDDGTAVSLLEGLRNAGGDFSYTPGPVAFSNQPTFTSEVEVNESDRSGWKEAIRAAKRAETVVMVLGEHGFQSGEARCRTDIGLPGLQQELLEAVYAVNQNVVLVLMNGRPLTIPWAADNVPAILETWQLGSQTGNAIAEVLYGDYNPSGKLPMTFPRSVGQIPIFYNRFSTARYEVKPHVFYSHYIDESNDPLYHFGHGLSYTTFEYSNLRIDTSNPLAVTVSVEVKNTGDRAGEEVTQLYIHDRYASVVRPEKELKGFEKYELAPGAAKTVTFTLTEEELGFYDNNGHFIVEPGWFDVMVGGSSVYGLTGEFERK